MSELAAKHSLGTRIEYLRYGKTAMTTLTLAQRP